MENRIEKPFDEEINLIDILIVLIKRKWIIIGLVLISLIASRIYVEFLTVTTYKTTVNIQLPQTYNIDEYSLLQANYPEPNEFIMLINESLNTFITDINKSDQETLFYSLNQKKKELTIQLSDDRKNIQKAILILYNIYQDLSQKMKGKNNNLYKLAQTTIEQNIIQKKQMIKNLSILLSKKSLTQLPAGSENAIIYLINTLSNDIMKLERNKGLNKEFSLQAGKFEVLGKTNSIFITNRQTLSNVDTYIYPEKSKKRKLLPVIVSVFLSFFIGIFLAFVIEFFSREDIKKRLREAMKK